jgi:hypothetical protein
LDREINVNFMNSELFLNPEHRLISYIASQPNPFSFITLYETLSYDIDHVNENIITGASYGWAQIAGSPVNKRHDRSSRPSAPHQRQSENDLQSEELGIRRIERQCDLGHFGGSQ